MTDVHSKIVRSYNMSCIKGKDTEPEMLVRRFLYSNGLRYRIHVKELPGKPDIVFRKYKTVIFINGCFWHGHSNCNKFSVPKTNTEWWLKKINKNITNDKKATKVLKKDGWKIITIWTCKLKSHESEKILTTVLKRLIRIGKDFI